MKEWGNLNCYSQQGWEALNALVKLFFFRRTNKGRHNSGRDSMSCNGKKSKLIPIIRLGQQRLLFICKFIDTDDNDVLDKISTKKRQQDDGNNIDNNDNDIILGLPNEEG